MGMRRPMLVAIVAVEGIIRWRLIQGGQRIQCLLLQWMRFLAQRGGRILGAQVSPCLLAGFGQRGSVGTVHEGQEAEAPFGAGHQGFTQRGVGTPVVNQQSTGALSVFVRSHRLDVDEHAVWPGTAAQRGVRCGIRCAPPCAQGLPDAGWADPPQHLLRADASPGTEPALQAFDAHAFTCRQSGQVGLPGRVVVQALGEVGHAAERLCIGQLPGIGWAGKWGEGGRGPGRFVHRFILGSQPARDA